MHATKTMTEFQRKVADWCVELFGKTIARNVQTRCYRFLEEAVELVQSLGMSREDCSKILDYVYGRPAGEPHQEVGGVAVTLAALCEASSISLHNAAWCEQTRCEDPAVKEKIRLKQKLKPNPLDVLPALVEQGLLSADYTMQTAHAAIDAAVDAAAVRRPGMKKAQGVEYANGGIHPGGTFLVGEGGAGFHMSADRSVAVADNYYTRTDMENCPRNTKVYLIGEGGVGTLAHYDGDPFWIEWAPVPKRKKA